ncbi:DUF2993 domain-containing protein [Coleofasciculus sp. FACHB-T130]|nr:MULTISPECIES: DUF2993 domain-containing protein [unclassified Coleofasciculus]MBD1837013.1 DUF2993 domain-containing protein [Coleofasciculus sp. FACHB-501]MBD1877580.1 DUF2993 domain-containing protein [Coleofasciculus sp. FACHB-T130]MBD2086329.1 DUF2993 domain-containing protein [Coleofasciculus sp. FACHB-542]MBD2538984.1 DUF2993 domain-containing protein [Coleofasciculus sp. FACHB-SPT36]
MGQQALNKAAEIGLSSQLDEVEELAVDIQSDPLKMVQGQVDSVTVEGEGLVMNKDLRMQEMKMEMRGISINPLSAAFGKIELTKPTDATTHVVLTEADINRAFNSEFVGSKLQSMQVSVNGQPMTIDTKKVDFRLPGENKIALSADVLLRESGETTQIAFTAVPRVGANGQKVNLEDVEYTEGKELSPELTAALLEKSSELLNLSNFDLQGMSLRIKQLNLESGKMTLLAEARVEQIPSG